MRIPRSIKWSLQIWHGVILLLVLTGFGWTAFEFQKTREFRRVDEELHERMRFLIGPPGRPRPRGEFDFGPGRAWNGPPERLPRSGPEEEKPELRRDPPDRRQMEFRFQRERLFGSEDSPSPFYYVIWGRDGQVVREEGSEQKTPRPDRMPPGGIRTRRFYREFIQNSPRGEMVLVGRSVAPELSGLSRLAILLLASGGGILALGLTGGWIVATRSLQPVEAISQVAAKIASGDLSQRIPLKETQSELGKLVSVLNSTFARLEAAFSEQARFTTDVSHELRTPVAVIVSQTQTALARERPAAEYRETVEACQRAAQRMRRLIESLLQLSRLDAGQEALNVAATDLAKVAAECASMLRPLADERKIQLRMELGPAPCRADGEKVSQVITNLLTNAIYYTPEGGEVILRTAHASGMARLSVSDNGPGIADENLPHLFDRFYRVERSRSREKGGSGLGLAISRSIVNAHGGTLDVTSKVGVGTTFTVRLPE